MLQRVFSIQLYKNESFSTKTDSPRHSARQKRNFFFSARRKQTSRPMLQRVFSIQLYKNGFFLEKKLE